MADTNYTKQKYEWTNLKSIKSDNFYENSHTEFHPNPTNKEKMSINGDIISHLYCKYYMHKT
jgi:hypothetical protein